MKPGARLALVSAPRDFTLGALPQGAKLARGLRGSVDLALCYYFRKCARSAQSREK